MKGRASALGAITILNAIANWKGSAIGIDIRTTANVELDSSPKVLGDVLGIDTTLIVKCVELVLERFGLDLGGVVRTYSDIPVASGLKSSSSAANATVLATLDAIGEKLDPLEAIKIGVEAARFAGVTITGAFDDATASMLGGVVVTDNRLTELLKRDEIERDVLLLVPDKRIYTKDTNVHRSRLIAPLADLVFDLAIDGDYERAMTLNGFIYCGALGLSTEPLLVALDAGSIGVSLSGTGPSYAALVDVDCIDELEDAWRCLGGKVIRTKVNNTGASIG